MELKEINLPKAFRGNGKKYVISVATVVIYK
jgi:hypothetical protein